MELDKLELAGDVAGFQTVIDAQLAVDASDLGFDGVGGDDKLAGNLRVGAASDEEAQDTLLLRAERFGSYWIESTLAGTPSLLRRKSISRYARL